MLYENSKSGNSGSKLSLKYNRASARNNHHQNRKVSDSVPLMKKAPIIDVERQKYMKKERRKIEAEIDKYN